MKTLQTEQLKLPQTFWFGDHLTNKKWNESLSDFICHVTMIINHSIELHCSEHFNDMHRSFSKLLSDVKPLLQYHLEMQGCKFTTPPSLFASLVYTPESSERLT